MLDNAQEVKDGEYPFYTTDSYLPKAAMNIPQGPGSNLDADTIQGLYAVTSSKAGPNKLVATDSNGKLPPSVFSLSSDFAGAITVIDTLENIKASTTPGIYMAFATNVGLYGSLVLKTNNPLFGDSGVILLGGS